MYDRGGNVERREREPQRTRKRVPPEQTHAENYYYKKQMEGRTPMVIVLNDGETVFGSIEWYDKNCIKLHRNGEPNLLVFKHSIKYLYKQERFRKEPVKEVAVVEEEPLEELEEMELAAEEEEEVLEEEVEEEEELEEA
jgi:sRNA-binding regulator protein Hfq